MRFRVMLTTVAVLLTAYAGPMLAQELSERDRERMEQRLEEAQQRLSEALEQVRASRDDAARSEFDRAMRAMRDAERVLESDRWGRRFEVIRAPRGNAFVTLFGDSRPRIGVVVQMDRNAGTDSIGAKLTAVTPGGPADEAGLESGDVITHVNGEQLAVTRRTGRGPGDRLIGIVRGLDEGDVVKVEYRRDDEKHTADVELRRMDSGAFAYAFGDSGTMEFDMPNIFIEPDIEVNPDFRPRIRTSIHQLLPFGWLDIELVTLNEDLATYFGTAEGLLVVRAPDDPALNLKSGDVILRVDGREPTSPSHALRIMRSYEPGESMEMEIMRNKRRMTITATIPEPERGFFWRDR